MKNTNSQSLEWLSLGDDWKDKKQWEMKKQRNSKVEARVLDKPPHKARRAGAASC
jgi:hypothetical protein